MLILLAIIATVAGFALLAWIVAGMGEAEQD